MKKLLSVFLSICMLLSITAGLDLTVLANTSGDYEYTILDDGTAEIKKYNGSETDVTVPSTLDGYEVTSIGVAAYASSDTIKNIVVPDNIKNISEYAFYNNNVLISAKIGNGVTRLGFDAFEDCSKLGSIIIGDNVPCIESGTFYNCKSLINVNIPDSVTSIENGAFYGCTNLSSMKIGKSVKHIGKSSFERCLNLSTVTFPDGLISICDDAFYNCSSITSLVFPDTLETISDYAFWNCYSLKTVIIGSGVKSIGKYAIHSCPNIKDIYYVGSREEWDKIDISTNDSIDIEKIHFNTYKNGYCYYKIEDGEANLFYCDKSASGEIVIPATIADCPVTSIADKAFRYCLQITSVSIPNSVRSIGNSAFERCEGLVNVSLPDNLAIIEENTFNTCKSLKSITIPDSIEIIGYYAFGDCGSLKEVLFGNGVTKISCGAFCYCSSLTNIVIPDSVTIIEDDAFYNCTGLKNIVIPDSVTSIGDYTFYNCYSLTSIVIPNNVTSIGYCSFYNCSGLSTIIIPKNVTSIGRAAFYDCTGLTSITISKNVTSISEYAFYNCPNLKNIYYTGSEEEWNNISIENSNDGLLNATIEYNVPEPDTVPEHTHSYTTVTTKATLKKNGNIAQVCSKCGERTVTKVIYYPKTVKLSTASYTYNGKAKKPGVTVKDSKGKAIAKSNYTVTYAKGRKNVGKYKVTVKFKGNYSGTKTLYFTIKPKATSIAKVTAGKKAFILKWKKQSTQTTGYQIQYATDSKFKKNKKTVTISKNKTTSKKVTGLKSNKKYYVRVRTYKTIKVNGKSTKIYSGWSKVKTVTTKK